jgi:glucose/arabinose dehydrogenase
MKLRTPPFLILALLLGAPGTEAEPYRLQNALPGLSFEQPVYLTNAGDGTQRLFVVEKRGTIRVLDPGAEQASTFLDLRDVVRAFRPETGLLGLAFHPDYETNGRFFVHYSGASFRSFLSEFRVSSDPDSALRESERVLLEVRQPSDMHNGGQLEFGPDGYLYAGFGDGGGPDDRFANGQDRATLLGTILRLDVDAGEPYGIPPDNPFVGNVQGWRQEIWAWGLRNPWRFSFDRGTGTMWIADVGQGDLEEISLGVAGGNFGWPEMEGNSCFTAGCDPSLYEPAVFEYGRSTGVSITGGHVYRGCAMPDLQGNYFFSDYNYNDSPIWTIRQAADGAIVGGDTSLEETGGLISSFGEDEAGEIYFVHHLAGLLLKIVPSS